MMFICIFSLIILNDLEIHLKMVKMLLMWATLFTAEYFLLYLFDNSQDFCFAFTRFSLCQTHSSATSEPNLPKNTHSTQNLLFNTIENG